MARKNSIKDSNSDRIFYAVNDFILLIIFLIVMFPLIHIVSASFSDTDAVMSGKVFLLPVNPTLDGYKAVFDNKNILNGYANTIFYTVAGTFINILMTICAAYPLSRKDFKYRKQLMFIFVFTMFFSGGIIPMYILVKDLGLMNTRWSLILPVALNVYNMIITRTFFENNIPDELLEASKIDGCTDFQFVRYVVLPLSKSIISVITLFYAVFHWNSFFNAMIYITDRDKFPLQVILREILILNEISLDANVNLEALEAKQGLRELLKYSSIIVASLPVLVIYPIIQRNFVKGVMIGSVKG